MKITVQFMCPSCEKCFVDKGSFQPYYNCDNCTEYWLKEDGRQCPQCHKFGRNPDMPVCDDCTSEVEEFIGEVDPDERDVIDGAGSEIISEKKAATRKDEMHKAQQAQAKMKEAYDQRNEVLKSELAQFGINETQGEYVVAFRVADIVDAEVSVRAIAKCQYFGNDIEPFQLEFRMRVGGRELDSGWDGYIGKSQRFAGVGELVAFARERINQPISFLESPPRR